MQRKVIIVGAGGHGKVIADIVKASGDYVMGFLDDNMDKNRIFCGVPVLGAVNTYTNYIEAEFIIAVGDNSTRKRISESLTDVNWYTAIHPSSVISDNDTEIGEGTVVMANTVINAGASIGCHCIINTAAVIEHDNIIGDYSHIAVGAKLAGTVHTGEMTFAGAGSVIINNIDICDECIIGAGAAVIDNITEKGTYVGVPAVKKK